MPYYRCHLTWSSVKFHNRVTYLYKRVSSAEEMSTVLFTYSITFSEGITLTGCWKGGHFNFASVYELFYSHSKSTVILL